MFFFKNWSIFTLLEFLNVSLLEFKYFIKKQIDKKMPNEKRIKKEEKIVTDEEKIQFGKKTFICFACGQKISKETKNCPYCGTIIN